MATKINHIAIQSSNFLLVGKFYEAIFGMKFASGRTGRGLGAATVRDGYVGLNINPRGAGRPAGLDHFGVEVDDVQAVFEKMGAKYPEVKWLKRPSNRPFAAISTHDPDGNIFDLSQKNFENRDGLYAEEDSEQKRHISHYAIRTMRPELCAQFYVDVLDLAVANKREGDPNHYLTDGRMTIEIIPWDINAYDKTGVVRPGPDHIGFKVESVETVKREIEDLAARSGHYGPWPLTGYVENERRRELLAEACPLGTYQFCDNDGVLFDIAE